MSDQEHEQNQDDSQGQTHDPGQTQGQDPPQTKTESPVEQQDLSQATESGQIQNANEEESHAQQTDTTQALPSESSDFSPPADQHEFFAQPLSAESSDFSPTPDEAASQEYSQQAQEPVQEEHLASDPIEAQYEHLAQVEEPPQYDQSQPLQDQEQAQDDNSHYQHSQQDISQEDIGQQDIAQQEIAQEDIGQQDIAQQEIAQEDIAQLEHSQYEQDQPVATEAQQYQESASAENVQPAQNTSEAHAQHIGHKPLADELGITDIYDPMVGMDGKVFCTAGRDAPIAEFTDEVLILHPPQRPLDDSSAGEDFSLRVDERGILLDEFNKPKKIPAATYKGCPIYYLGEQVPGTLTQYAAALAHDGSLHALFYEQGSRLTTKDVYELRNKSTMGDLHEFPDIICDI